MILFRIALTLLVAFFLPLAKHSGASAQSAPPSHSEASPYDGCVANPAQCGISIPISDTLGGVNNSAECLTARIVDLPQQVTDYIPVCRSGDGNAAPDAVGDDGTPRCTPFPPGRLPASWEQTTLPSAGSIGMNPAPEGLTGLESWFWYVGPTSHRWPSPVYEGRTEDCRVIPAPPPVMYSAAISQYRWSIGDSRPLLSTATETGAETAPAVRHRYRTKGRWEARVTCTWRGAPPTAREVECAQRSVPVTSVRAALTEGG